MFQTFYWIAAAVAVLTSWAAFVRKEAVTWASIMAFTSSGVLAFGSLSVTTLDGGSEFVYSSEPMAVLWTLNALVAIIVFAASLTGQFGIDDHSTGLDSGLDSDDITNS